MNLVLLIGHFPPAAFGGAELQAEGWARRLAARHDVTVITRGDSLRAPGEETRDGFRDRSLAAWRSVRNRPSRALQRDATEVGIALVNGPRPFAIDGEDLPDTEDLRVVIEPGALRVLAP